MAFYWKYLYLISGLFLLIGSITRLIWLIFFQSREADGLNSNEEFPKEIELVIVLVGMVMGGILLREAYYMVYELSLSAAL